MQKKTFIKVRRGILDAKHVQTLGVRFAYYLQLLDLANWETGKVLFYRDQDIADKFEMNIRTIRDWRTTLQSDGYITCVQKKHHQEIIINKWENPRGKGDINPVLKNDEDDTNMSPLEEKSIEGDTNGDTNGGNQSVTLPYSSDFTYQNKTIKGINLLSTDESKKFIVLLESLAGDYIEKFERTLINSPKRMSGNCIQVFVNDPDTRKFINEKAKKISEVVLSKNFSKGITFFDSFECVPFEPVN
jgi:uncharacterized protein Usg